MVAEFQAIVLAAGRSSPLEELLPTPKPLLQIGNFPLIYYPLQWLKKNGFEEAIVVVSESTKNDIFLALAPYFENELDLDFVAIPDDQDCGTAETLRDLHNKKKITTDMIVLGCDLISDISLQDVANVFRMHDASVTVVYHKAFAGDVVVPGTKSKKTHDREIVGLDPVTNRIILATSEADIEDSLEIYRYLLMRYPRIRIRTALQDAHVYLLKRWVLDLLVANQSMTSLRSEVIPFLIKKQHRSKTSTFPASQSRRTPNELDNHHNDAYNMLNRVAEEDGLALFAREMSMWSDHQGDMCESYFGNSVRCYAYLAENGFCFRVNSILAFCEANRQIPRILQLLLRDPDEVKYIHPNAVLLGKAQVGADSMIGEQTTVADKVSIKKSIVGRNCNIAEKSKISSCVIMDGVVIGENSNIQGSVICSHAQIGDRTELKDCLLGEGFVVPSNSKFTNETLTDADRMLEI